MAIYAAQSPHSQSEVPYVKSRLPWLGHGLRFAKDADQLLAELQSQYGDEFTIKLGGKKFTFLLNPHDYPCFFKQSQTLKADAISMEISGKAFGIDWNQYAVGIHELQVPFDRSMRRSQIGSLTETMHRLLEARLFEQTSNQWQQGELYHFVAKLIFEAGGGALMGEGLFEDDTLFNEFLFFDSQLPLLITGLPKSVFFRRSNRFLKKMYGLLQQPNPGQSAVMDLRFETMKDVTSVEEMGRNNAGLFWATQANTVVMAFYTVLFILRDLDAKAAVVQEVRSVLDTVAENNGGDLTFDQQSLSQLVLLDACLDEVLRLKTASMPIRKAEQDTVLELSSGRELLVKKGDIVTLYPRTTHMNPQIYPNPHEFQWRRFVNKQGPNKFYYRGQPVKYNLMPFGGGKSICPGRHFARNEFKVLAAVFLYHLDLELLDTRIPDFDTSRAGLGALTPQWDLPFRYRLRDLTKQVDMAFK